MSVDILRAFSRTLFENLSLKPFNHNVFEPARLFFARFVLFFGILLSHLRNSIQLLESRSKRDLSHKTQFSHIPSFSFLASVYHF
mmetsp:Transcript_17288/g.39763  ORF Transcript_17288/g.39763 Transcript_17288/m.39763 type:complete len:85 (-) Transcript_17288:30-284(-)